MKILLVSCILLQFNIFITESSNELSSRRTSLRLVKENPPMKDYSSLSSVPLYHRHLNRYRNRGTPNAFYHRPIKYNNRLMQPLSRRQHSKLVTTGEEKQYQNPLNLFHTVSTTWPRKRHDSVPLYNPESFYTRHPQFPASRPMEVNQYHSNNADESTKTDTGASHSRIYESSEILNSAADASLNGHIGYEVSTDGLNAPSSGNFNSNNNLGYVESELANNSNTSVPRGSVEASNHQYANNNNNNSGSKNVNYKDYFKRYLDDIKVYLDHDPANAQGNPSYKNKGTYRLQRKNDENFKYNSKDPSRKVLHNEDSPSAAATMFKNDNVSLLPELSVVNHIQHIEKFDDKKGIKQKTLPVSDTVLQEFTSSNIPNFPSLNILSDIHSNSINLTTHHDIYKPHNNSWNSFAISNMSKSEVHNSSSQFNKLFQINDKHNERPYAYVNKNNDDGHNKILTAVSQSNHRNQIATDNVRYSLSTGESSVKTNTSGEVEASVGNSLLKKDNFQKDSDKWVISDEAVLKTGYGISIKDHQAEGTAIMFNESYNKGSYVNSSDTLQSSKEQFAKSELILLPSLPNSKNKITGFKTPYDKQQMLHSFGANSDRFQMPPYDSKNRFGYTEDTKARSGNVNERHVSGTRVKGQEAAAFQLGNDERVLGSVNFLLEHEKNVMESDSHMSEDEVHILSKGALLQNQNSEESIVNHSYTPSAEFQRRDYGIPEMDTEYTKLGTLEEALQIMWTLR